MNKRKAQAVRIDHYQLQQALVKVEKCQILDFGFNRNIILHILVICKLTIKSEHTAVCHVNMLITQNKLLYQCVHQTPFPPSN